MPSNDDWRSPSDLDARIAKMKNGDIHLAYKAEHAVDLETEMIPRPDAWPARHREVVFTFTGKLRVNSDLERDVHEAFTTSSAFGLGNQPDP